MPRPSEGYRNAAGQQVPGVHDVTNAYCPKPALVRWAYGRGKAGLELYEKGAIDIGTTVHQMAELDLKGRETREIEACVHSSLTGLGDIAKAWQAFEAFCRWREQHCVRSIAHEVSLVSEIHQLGGTPDCIAFVDGAVGLLDFKSCTKVPSSPYAEQLLVMAAHATLWNEAHPDEKIAACHIVYLPKDGSPHKHHAHVPYEDQWSEFACLLAAFATKHGLPRPVDRRDAEIGRLKAELTMRDLLAPRKPRAPSRRARKQQAAAAALPPPQQKPLPSQPMTMGELLRSYGHVKG